VAYTIGLGVLHCDINGIMDCSFYLIIDRIWERNKISFSIGILRVVVEYVHVEPAAYKLDCVFSQLHIFILIH